MQRYIRFLLYWPFSGRQKDLIQPMLEANFNYRVTHLLADWVGLTWIWDVPLSCLGSTAAALQPNGLWNIPNQSHPNPGPWGDGSHCTADPICNFVRSLWM